MGLVIGEVLANAARVAPHAVAATVDDEQMTFGELDAASNRVANLLAGLGVARGERVLWWSDTALEALGVFGGAAKLGAVFAPLNARAGIDEVAPVAHYARPRLVVAGTSHSEPGRELARGLDVPFLGDLPSVASGASAAPPSGPGPAERDPHVVFFTSGSTGAPKGVVLSHRANWLRTYVGATTSSGGAGVVCMFPLFHMAGWTIALGAWQGRRPVHFVRTPDAEHLLSAVARHRASRLYCIPAVWSRILEHGLANYDLSSLVEADTGTSATPPELLAAIKAALPHTVTRVFYGSTESGPGLQLADPDVLRKPGSVGVPQPGVDVRLDAGEVCLRGPFLMDGYFDAPDATAEVLRGGWYHTGDLGAIDDEGYVSIVGRAREVIRTGGETVAPAEVEQVLASHPAVAEVAVVGLPDARWGEVVTAVVVARAEAGSPPDLDQFRSHCEGRLARFKHPRRLHVVAELPRTPATGQVQRTLIVERLLAGGPPPE